MNGVMRAPTLAMPLQVPRPSALVAVGYTWNVRVLARSHGKCRNSSPPPTQYDGSNAHRLDGRWAKELRSSPKAESKGVYRGLA